MQRRSEELGIGFFHGSRSPSRTLIRSTAAAAFCALAVLPSPLRGQDSDVRGTAGATLELNRLAGSIELLVGGFAALQFGSGLSVGGFGFGLPGVVSVDGGVVDQELSFGYGGLYVDRVMTGNGSLDVAAQLMVGAGNAQIRAQPIGNQLGSDNFLVVEPRIRFEGPPGSVVRGSFSIGYRFTLGVQDLPQLDGSDLRSLTVGVSVRVGGG